MYKMHSNAESELTSIALSSPSRPEYYVQSPSRESTPVLQSPAISPPHYAAGIWHHHSRESSSYTSRFSGSLYPSATAAGGRSKISPDENKVWMGIVEEESLLEGPNGDGSGGRGRSCRCYVLTFVCSFLVLFSVLSLILWAKTHHQKPVIAVKSIKFENFVIQAGTDASNVPTDLGTVNSTVKFTYRNTGSFFGVHVTSTPVTLYYQQLAMATGSIDYFYQKKKSERSLSVTVAGNQVPLYGGGSKLRSDPSKSSNEYVNMTLNFTVRSQAYVLGKLVRPKFYNNVQCLVAMDLSNLNKMISLKNSCQYN